MPVRLAGGFCMVLGTRRTMHLDPSEHICPRELPQQAKHRDGGCTCTRPAGNMGSSPLPENTNQFGLSTGKFTNVNSVHGIGNGSLPSGPRPIEGRAKRLCKCCTIDLHSTETHSIGKVYFSAAKTQFIHKSTPIINVLHHYIPFHLLSRR